VTGSDSQYKQKVSSKTSIECRVVAGVKVVAWLKMKPFLLPSHHGHCTLALTIEILLEGLEVGELESFCLFGKDSS